MTICHKEKACILFKWGYFLNITLSLPKLSLYRNKYGSFEQVTKQETKIVALITHHFAAVNEKLL
ncbi:hypothetical protein P7G97_03155 [Enterococcus canintestini]|nr:hypothetical protein [Enterococcus canintestini]